MVQVTWPKHQKHGRKFPFAITQTGCFCVLVSFYLLLLLFPWMNDDHSWFILGWLETATTTQQQPLYLPYCCYYSTLANWRLLPRTVVLYSHTFCCLPWNRNACLLKHVVHQPSFPQHGPRYTDITKWMVAAAKHSFLTYFLPLSSSSSVHTWMYELHELTLDYK